MITSEFTVTANVGRCSRKSFDYFLSLSKGFFLLMWIASSGEARSTSNELSASKNVVGLASQIITKSLIQVNTSVVYRIRNNQGIIF